VSFVRAYSKHEASYIFRIKDLDLIGVARSFGLLRLPKMPEFKGLSRDGWEDADVDWNTFAYKDKAQEVKRLVGVSAQTNEKEKKKALPVEKRKLNSAWSHQVGKKEEKDHRKEKKDRKKKWLKTRPLEEETTEQLDLKRMRVGSLGEDDNDWNELAREERMAKRVRRGEVTQGTFDQEFTDL